MALYHSAKGPNNYTVVGSPAIVDGIAGGFSANNYLTLPSASSLSIDTMEWNVKFTTGSSVIQDYSQFFLGYEAHGGMSVRVSSGYFQFTWLKNDTYAWEEKVSTYVLSPNTTYIANMKFNNTSGTVDVSLKNSNGEILYSNTYSNTSGRLYGTPVMGMRGNSSSYPNNYFKGSIDLNETYITVNGQPWFGNCPVEVKKHQIKGPVGYTVVGSPTIVDGVLSNTGTGTGLQLPYFSLYSQTSFEYVVKIKRGQSDTGTNGTILTIPMRCIANNTKLISGGIYKSGNTLTVFAGYTSENTSASYQLPSQSAGDIIYVKWEKKNGICSVSYSLDNSTWTEGTTDGGANNTEIRPNYKFALGYPGTNLDNFSWPGFEIDLNNTYIKVNGKLWFYQPAPTKYIVKDGKLVWADPNIYLKFDGNSYIDTELKGNEKTELKLIYSQPNALANNSLLIGARTSVSSNNISIYAMTNDTTRWDFGSYNDCHQSVAGSVGNKIEVLAKASSGYVKNLTTNTTTMNTMVYTGSFETPQTLLLGSRLHGDYSVSFTDSTCKCYSLSISNAGTLLQYLVPVPAGLQIGNFTVPSNGMFDIVNQQFYANQGTGAFTIGRDE